MTVQEVQKEQSEAIAAPLVKPSARMQAAAIAGLGVVLALLLALPGRTVTTKYFNDLLIFLDGGYRLVSGQVPNVDFHSSLGPFTYVIVALGYAVGGSWTAAMPVGMALVLLCLSLAAAHIVGTRMRPAIGLPIAAFLLLVAAAPLNTGEGIDELSFGMFYNRLGWCTLGLVLIMYLAPTAPHRAQTILDAACCAFLILLMGYLKVTYSLVMLAFVGFMLLDRKQWRWAVLALVLTAAVALLVELFWGGSAGYVADIRSAAAVSGNAPGLHSLATTVQQNLADIAVFGIFAVLLLFVRRRLRDFLFLGFCVATGVLIIDQNFQIWGIVSLAAGAAVAAEALSRDKRDKFEMRPRLAAGAPFLLAAFLLPGVAHHVMALGLHAGLALTRQGEPVALPNFEGITIARLWRDGASGRFLGYNESLRDGAEALNRLDGVGRVLALDFVSPFAAGLGLEPAQGDSTWFHWGRTINDAEHPAAEDLFKNVDVVMMPKSPVERWTASGMHALYIDYVAARYRLVEETEFWSIYRAPGSSKRPLALHSE